MCFVFCVFKPLWGFFAFGDTVKGAVEGVVEGIQEGAVGIQWDTVGYSGYTVGIQWVYSGYTVGYSGILM